MASATTARTRPSPTRPPLRPPTVEPKHVDPDAPAENTYGIEATGGKHAARD